jgi:hypothetical protein
MGTQFLLACEEVDARRASAGQTEEFLADGHPAQPNSLPFAAPEGAANVLPREARERRHFSSLPARRWLAGTQAPGRRSGIKTVFDAASFAALFVFWLLGVRLAGYLASYEDIETRRS